MLVQGCTTPAETINRPLPETREGGKWTSSSSAVDKPSKLNDASAPRAFRLSPSDRNRVGIDTSRQACQEYNQRFHPFREELRKAREKGYLGKIESLKLQMEELTSAVAKATGLGGTLPAEDQD